MTRPFSPLRLTSLSLILCAGCGKGEETSPASLLAGVFLVPPIEADGSLLVVSRFEVTRAEFAAESDPELRELPAVMMSQAEAAAWAAEQGMRLPTRAEWIQARMGGGPPSQEAGRANTLELGLGRALPVGAFESGRTGLGGYDFDGNVWEWLALEEDLQSSTGELLGTQAGGSFASYRATQEEQWFRPASPALRASDVGFRTVADAIPWLEAVALPVFLQASRVERSAMALEVATWSRELRIVLARRWRAHLPEQREFAELLDPAPGGP